MQLRPLLPLLGPALRNRSRPVAALILAATLAGNAPAGGEVKVTVIGLRSQNGQMLACLSPHPKAFPDCSRDPGARRLVVPLNARTAEIDFGPVPAGAYAIALIHDENGNNRMDKAAIMPREGFGFSRDAPVRFGPPSFQRAAFSVTDKPVHQIIRMRYIL